MESEKDGRGVTFEQAQPIFKELWDGLPLSEQIRILDLVHSPKAEPFRAATIVVKRGGRNGPGDNKETKITMAVSAGKVL